MSAYTRGLLERFCAIADIQEDRLKEGDYVVATVTERRTGRIITIDRAVNLPLDRWQRDIELFAKLERHGFYYFTGSGVFCRVTVII